MHVPVPEPVPVDARIRVGIAGWSYPDWDGYVYPPRTPDRLRYVAGFVDVIEINSSFYRPPAARDAEAWARRTPDCPGLRFTAKLHQEITHGGRLDPALVAALCDGLAPLRDAGRLQQLLAQFRYDFADCPAARDWLCRIRDAFVPLAPLVFELRHGSWQAPETIAFLRTLDSTVANLDYPTAHDSFTLAHCDVGRQAYLRLHGRNREAWFQRGAGRDQTYNYLYSADELNAILARARTIAGGAASLTVIANNHYQGKEMVNALELKAALAGGRVAVPAPLLRRYPRLAAIAAPAAAEEPFRLS